MGNNLNIEYIPYEGFECILVKIPNQKKTFNPFARSKKTHSRQFYWTEVVTALKSLIYHDRLLVEIRPYYSVRDYSNSLEEELIDLENENKEKDIFSKIDFLDDKQIKYSHFIFNISSIDYLNEIVYWYYDSNLKFYFINKDINQNLFFSLIRDPLIDRQSQFPQLIDCGVLSVLEIQFPGGEQMSVLYKKNSMVTNECIAVLQNIG